MAGNGPPYTTELQMIPRKTRVKFVVHHIGGDGSEGFEYVAPRDMTKAELRRELEQHLIPKFMREILQD